MQPRLFYPYDEYDAPVRRPQGREPLPSGSAPAMAFAGFLLTAALSVATPLLVDPAVGRALVLAQVLGWTVLTTGRGALAVAAIAAFFLNGFFMHTEGTLRWSTGRDLQDVALLATAVLAGRLIARRIRQRPASGRRRTRRAPIGSARSSSGTSP